MKDYKYFSNPLPRELNHYINRIKNKKASLIIISGGVGLGKTTFAVHIANYINQQNTLDPIKLELKNHPQYSMGADEFKDYIDKCFINKLPCLIYDEAGDYDKRNALGTLNKELNRLFDTCRAFGVVPILCLPNIKVLDFRLFDKGIAILHLYITERVEPKKEDDEGYSIFNAYGLEQTNYILKILSNNRNLPTYKAYQYVTPGFKGAIWNLPKEQSTALDELSMMGKRQVVAKIRGLMNYKEIAIELDISLKTIQAKIYDLKMKPYEKIGGKVYFNKDQIREIRTSFKKEKKDERESD